MIYMKPAVQYMVYGFKLTSVDSKYIFLPDRIVFLL